MTNLLPQDIAKKQRRRFLMRGILLLSLLIFGFSAVAMLALTPPLVLIRANAAALEEEIRTLDNSLSVRQERVEREELSAAREQIDALSDVFDADRELTEALRTAIERRPDGIALERIHYSRLHTEDENGERGELAVSGTAPDQDALSEYIASLEGARLFTSVDLPLSTLARVEGGTFSITITGSF